MFSAVTGVSDKESSSESNTSSLLLSQNNRPVIEEGSTSRSILIASAVCLIACSSEIIIFSFLTKMLFEVLNIFSISSSGAPIETAKVRFPAGTKTLYFPSLSVVALP